MLNDNHLPGLWAVLNIGFLQLPLAALVVVTKSPSAVVRMRHCLRNAFLSLYDQNKRADLLARSSKWPLLINASRLKPLLSYLISPACND